MRLVGLSGVDRVGEVALDVAGVGGGEALGYASVYVIQDNKAQSTYTLAGANLSAVGILDGKGDKILGVGLGLLLDVDSALASGVGALGHGGRGGSRGGHGGDDSEYGRELHFDGLVVLWWNMSCKVVLSVCWLKSGLMGVDCWSVVDGEEDGPRGRWTGLYRFHSASFPWS